MAFLFFTFLTRDRALSKRSRGGWKGTFDGEAVEEEQEEKEEGFSSFFLSRSRSLDSSKRSLLFFFDIDPIIFVRRNEGKFLWDHPLLIRWHLVWFAQGKGEKDNNNTTKKTASCASTFQFCTHDYPVYYISSTLQIRTYASSENEKQEIILVLHLPRTPKEEKRKKRIFIRDCTRSTRSNERMNPGIQKKRLLSRLCARTTRLYTRHAVFRCIRHARLRLYYSRWDYPEPFPATTTTTLYCLRLYALTHIYTHAVRNRSEMFDLLHVLSTAEKGLVSTDFQFIGIKDEGQRAIRNGSFIMDYMEKCENYIFKLYLFSTAAGRISFTEDSIYT